ncbi:MAG: hypothetical protein QNI94_08765 [Kiloniellales bacterium]|nr:hypothetical protein [Kiloniellales bacterium]
MRRPERKRLLDGSMDIVVRQDFDPAAQSRSRTALVRRAMSHQALRERANRPDPAY